MWFAYLVLAQLFCSFAISSTNPFGCKNKKIGDDWRKAVVDFHNQYRRMLASGKQTTAGGKLMPYAKNMNELSWDCDLEEVAHSQLCNGLSLDDIYAVLYNNMNVFADVIKRTISELKYWWSEAEEVDLSLEPKYSYLYNDFFAAMAYAKNTRFACTYGNCSTGGILQCVYEQKPHDGELIYQKAKTPKKICTACTVDHKNET
ncbi:hypothetical protein Aduo_000132 [Ancylostoma duodenale]